MLPDDKIIIARNWCYKIDTSYSRTMAKITYVNALTLRGSYEYTQVADSYNELVDIIFNMVRNFVWKEICKMS